MEEFAEDNRYIKTVETELENLHIQISKLKEAEAHIQVVRQDLEAQARRKYYTNERRRSK